MTAEVIIRDLAPADAEAVRLLNMRAPEPDHAARLEFIRRHYRKALERDLWGRSRPFAPLFEARLSFFQATGSPRSSPAGND